MKVSTLNRIWSRLILTVLHRSGIKDICIAPGSRSSPLTLEAQRLHLLDNEVNLHTHFDERGLGFLALGLAKTSARPVIVIVTSGTAVANLMPAVAESRLTREKLFLLTADRPIELLQSGANQAITQRQFFGEHADVFCDLPSPTESISPAWLLSRIDESLFQQAKTGGCVHINCPFPEPLYGEMEKTEPYLSSVASWLEGDDPFLSFTHTKADLAPFMALWGDLQNKKGLLLVGKVSQEERHVLDTLALRLGWPILCCPQAGEASSYAGFDLWLQNAGCRERLEQAECVLQFGGRLVSKRLSQFLEHFNGDFFLIDPHPGRLDPQNHQGMRLLVKPEELAKAALEALFHPKEKHWAIELEKASQAVFSLVSARFNEDAPISEVAMAVDFSHWIAPKTDLFVGNSLAIRVLDMFCRLPDRAVFANRGASGIDGLIATACGVQRGRKHPMICLLGDTSALYDLNSLSLLRQNTQPFVLLILNNDGGGIFDLLPIPKENRNDFYRLPHGLHFSHAAAMFGLRYLAPTSLSEAKTACLDAQERPFTTLIELTMPAGLAAFQIRTLFEEIAHADLL